MPDFLTRCQEILAQVAFHSYTFQVVQEGSNYYLQGRFMAPCNVSGEVHEQSTRKWRLSVHMTKSEIVQTALKLVLTSVEHEVREQFTYRGQPIFGPHYDVDVLVGIVSAGNSQDERHLHN